MSSQTVAANGNVNPHGREGLRRTLSRADLVIYGLAILTPTAAYPVFGIVQQTSQGHAALSYLVAMVAMLFTAASYGKMAAAFPVAGSTYTYAQQGLHAYVGFLAGWAMILDYVLVPLLSAVFVSLTAVRLVPQVPFSVWSLAFCVSITLVNARGIQVTKRANTAMLVIMSASAVLFVALAAGYVLNQAGFAGLFNERAVLNRDTFALSPLMLGVGIATLSYLGFDAVSTLAEETKHPETDIGFATVFVCILQTIICFLIVYLAAVVWPSNRPFANIETAILDISQLVGGRLFFGFTTFVLLVAGVASSLASQAGASRLLFGMGRDRMLPHSVFGYLDPTYATPTRSIYLMGVISFVGSLLIDFQAIVELVNFGAFAGFVLVNLSVIRYFYFRRRLRAGLQVLTNLIFPGLGALVCVYVWFNLNTHSKVLGFAWLGVGTVYLAFLTGFFRKPVRTLELP